MRFCLLMSLLVFLSACVDKNSLPTISMLPAEALQDQMEHNPDFAKKFFAGEFDYAGQDSFDFVSESKQNWLRHYRRAVSKTLKIVGMGAKSRAQARYIISGEIKDFDLPDCLYGRCDGGSAVRYIVQERKTEEILIDKLIIVPYSKPVAFSFQDDPEVKWLHAGRVLSENIAHFIHFLSKEKLDQPL